jgi:hypothetical protein
MKTNLESLDSSISKFEDDFIQCQVQINIRKHLADPQNNVACWYLWWHALEELRNCGKLETLTIESFLNEMLETSRILCDSFARRISEFKHKNLETEFLSQFREIIPELQ